MSVSLANDTLTLELSPAIGGSVSGFAFRDGSNSVELFRKAMGNTVLEQAMFRLR
jgi:hypothetical protein